MVPSKAKENSGSKHSLTKKKITEGVSDPIRW
jgi:hypothetical protein